MPFDVLNPPVPPGAFDTPGGALTELGLEYLVVSAGLRPQKGCWVLERRAAGFGWCCIWCNRANRVPQRRRGGRGILAIGSDTQCQLPRPWISLAALASSPTSFPCATALCGV